MTQENLNIYEINANDNKSNKPDWYVQVENNIHLDKQNRTNNKTSLNYQNIIEDRDNFRYAGTKNGSGFNLFDMPGHKYFKLLFYFVNGDSEGNSGIESSGGLLSPTWELMKDSANIKHTNLYNYNSAWSYLMVNDELERADQLKSFVSLLSNINSESPWYFKELTGLDSALERKAITEQSFKFDEARQKISIKCEQDSVDDRIGTLLDLYRSVVWSNIHKREIVPANLRKFDMGIYIYESPIIPNHHYGTSFSTLNEGSSHQASYKYIELHNCEIDYNSSKSPYATLNNTEGTPMEYTIDIYFDDCYERRFNEFALKNIGDLIMTDLNLVYEKKDYSKNKIVTDMFSSYYEGDLEKPQAPEKKKEKNFIKNVLEEGKELIKSIPEDFIKQIYLGNLFSFSLSNAIDYGKKFADGQLIQTGKVIKNKITAAQNKRKANKSVEYLGNLFKSNTIINNI